MIPLPLNRVASFEERLERTWWSTRHGWPKRRDALMLGLCLCGLRSKEVLGLRRQDLGIEDAQVLVRTAKGGVNRIIPVGLSWMMCCRQMIRLFPSQRRSEQVFLTRTWYEVSYKQLWRRCLVWTKFFFERPYSPHCLRHTAAVRLYLATHDVMEVHRFLGHTSLQWTRVYLSSITGFDSAGLPGFVNGAPGRGLRLFDPEHLVRVAT